MLDLTWDEIMLAVDALMAMKYSDIGPARRKAAGNLDNHGREATP